MRRSTFSGFSFSAVPFMKTKTPNMKTLKRIGIFVVGCAISGISISSSGNGSRSRRHPF